jgi:hypothetical protein
MWKDCRVPTTTCNIALESRESMSGEPQAGEPDRKIARFVGLSGRKYALYKRMCRELGFAAAEQQAEGET